LEARRIGVRNVAGQQALALGAKHQRLGLELQAVGEAVQHGPSVGCKPNAGDGCDCQNTDPELEPE
jgi:hypothetical protein